MPSYTARELERETGFGRRTIAYYIQEGLLPKVGRRGPRTRYPELVLDRLLFIRRVREAEEAGEIGPVPLRHLREVFRNSARQLIADVARGRLPVAADLVSPSSIELRSMVDWGGAVADRGAAMADPLPGEEDEPEDEPEDDDRSGGVGERHIVRESVRHPMAIPPVRRSPKPPSTSMRRARSSAWEDWVGMGLEERQESPPFAASPESRDPSADPETMMTEGMPSRSGEDTAEVQAMRARLAEDAAEVLEMRAPLAEEVAEVQGMWAPLVEDAPEVHEMRAQFAEDAMPLQAHAPETPGSAPARVLGMLQAVARRRRELAPGSVDTWSQIDVTPDIRLSVRGLADEDMPLLRRVGRLLGRMVMGDPRRRGE